MYARSLALILELSFVNNKKYLLASSITVIFNIRALASHKIYIFCRIRDRVTEDTVGENGKAKSYQIKQVSVAIDKLENLKNDC